MDSRLSNLPDDLIHKILSFMTIKYAIKTSVLSSRWRYIWTSMPVLNFATEDFTTLPKFTKFVKHVLSHRNNQVQMSSIKLTGHWERLMEEDVISIMKSVFSQNVVSQNVQKLEIEIFYWYSRFPITLFGSQSTFELPALTTLHLSNVTIVSVDNTDKSIGLLSNCPNLKNLNLEMFSLSGWDVLSICQPLLSDLTLEDVCGSFNVVEVNAPQLKNLTIRDCRWKDCQNLICAPNLALLKYEGRGPLPFSTTDLHSLEKVDICIFRQEDEIGFGSADAHEIVHQFQQLQNVKYLTLNLEILELLSSYVEVISHQPSPFANLKSVTISPKMVNVWVLPEEIVSITMEVRHSLQDGSPGATFTMVSREEAIADMNATEAKFYLNDLRMYLEEKRYFIETNRPNESHNANMHDQGNAEPMTKMQLGIRGDIEQIERYWIHQSMQIDRGKSVLSYFTSSLMEIERLLTTLPASKRAIIQPCFSSLCAEIDIFMSKMTDYVKIQCDENLSHASVRFHELATSLQSSS